MMIMLPEIASNNHYSPDSRLWVYVAERRLSDDETAWATQQLAAFARQWTAHSQALLATAEIIDNQVVVLMVDETRAGASGCSIDKSVHFLEQIGQQLGVDFFDRMTFGWVDESGQTRFAKRNEFSDLVKNATITPNTLVLNTLIQYKKDFEQKWLLPFGESWHKRLV